MKVKEPLAVERKKLRRDQILFTYLHLAPDRAQTEDLLHSGVTAIAYETVTGPNGTLPLADADVGGRRAHGAACRARAAWKRKMADVASSSAECPACRPQVSSFSAAASPEQTRL